MKHNKTQSCCHALLHQNTTDSKCNNEYNMHSRSKAHLKIGLSGETMGYLLEAYLFHLNHPT